MLSLFILVLMTFKSILRICDKSSSKCGGAVAVNASIRAFWSEVICQ